MVLVSVDFHPRHNLQYLAIHSGIEIALAAHALEEFTIVTLALTNEWSEEINRLALVFTENHIDDLFLGIFHHCLAASVAVGCAGTGVEQTEIVVNLSGGAHGGTWVFVGGLLLDADDWA